MLWYGPGTAPDALWSSTAPAGSGRARSHRRGRCHPLDWDGDGATDLLSGPRSHHRAAAVERAGRLDGGMTSMALNASGDAVPVVGDFDADGDEDVLF
ncbi:MAG: VCBS repeat-containing protein [Acidimicrobiales bacterium]